MLRGNALAKVDDKGRLKIPASFRAVLDPTYGKECFVTSIDGQSVRLYPMETYAQLEERLIQASTVQPLVTRLRNALNYYGQRATTDGQGRVLIHPMLRESAGIVGEVAVLGQQNYLELWNRATIEARLRNNPLTDDDLRELAALGF